jgi:hypothetical protein
MLKKCLHVGYQRLIGSWLYLISQTAFAWGDSDPFPRLAGNANGDVVQTIGTHMETMLKYALVGGGGLLILICIGVLVHRIREDNREKDHGNLIMTFVMLALGLTIGFALIGIGWTAFSTEIE